jgi:hypothetical protein
MLFTKFGPCDTFTAVGDFKQRSKGMPTAGMQITGSRAADLT